MLYYFLNLISNRCALTPAMEVPLLSKAYGTVRSKREHAIVHNPAPGLFLGWVGPDSGSSCPRTSMSNSKATRAK